MILKVNLFVLFFHCILVNKHKPWIETSYHGVITENNDTVILDPPLVALDKDAPVPFAGEMMVGKEALMVLLFSFLCGFPIQSFTLILSPSFLPHLGTVNKSVSSDMFLSHFLSKILPCPAGLPLYIMSFPCDVCFPCLFLFSSLHPEISLCFISSHFFLKASSTSPFFYPLYL